MAWVGAGIVATHDGDDDEVPHQKKLADISWLGRAAPEG